MKQLSIYLCFLFLAVCNISLASTNKKLRFQELVHHKHNTLQASKASSLFTPKRERNYYWDNVSNAWSLNDTSFYTYDNKAHVLSKLQKNINGVNIALESNTYASNGLLTNSLTKTWDLNTNAWVNSYQRTKSYDTHQNITLDQSEYWDNTTNTWVILSSNKYVYTYNAQSLISSITISTWDIPSLSFVSSTRTVNITYNNNGGKLNEQLEYFDQNSNVWTPYELDVYTYSNQNVLTSFVSSIYDGQGNWTPNYRALNLVWYAWNGNMDNSLIQSYTIENYDSNLSTWTPSTRANITYTNNNSNTTISETYNGTSWDITSKDVFIYDTYDNETLNESFSWDAQNNLWILGYGSTNQYQYTAQGAMTEKINQYYDVFTAMAYVNSSKSVYEDFIEFNWATGINSSNTIDANIFPNPSQDHFTIKLNQASALQIYNLLGELMYTTNNVSKVEVDCSNWPEGIYMIHMQNIVEGNFTKKFTKE